MTPFDEYLKLHTLTRYSLAEKTGIARSTFQTAGEATELSAISTKVIMAVASVIETSPGEVLDELENMFSHKNNYSVNQISQAAKAFIENRPGAEFVKINKFDTHHWMIFKYTKDDGKQRTIELDIKSLDGVRGKITYKLWGYTFYFSAAGLKSADYYKTNAQIMTCIESIIAADYNR